MTRFMRYTIDIEPQDDVYRGLLSLGSAKCSMATLVLRDQHRSSNQTRILHLLDPFLREVRFVEEWPGTQLIGHKAELREYLVTSKLVEVLSNVADRLYAWQEPDHPEDLCLFRSSGQVWLASISHEQDAYLLITNEEVVELREKVPLLRLSRDEDNECGNLGHSTPAGRGT